MGSSARAYPAALALREQRARLVQEGERRALVVDDRAQQRLRFRIAAHAVGLLTELAQHDVGVDLRAEALELLEVGLLGRGEHVEEGPAHALGELATRRAAELLQPRLEEPRVRTLAQLRVAQAAAQARDARRRDPRREGGLPERLGGAVLVEEVLDLARRERRVGAAQRPDLF